jgi:hypothetical protein
MALIQKAPSRLKQLKLAVVLIAVIGTTVGYAYFGLIKKSTPVDSTTGAGGILVPNEAKKDSLRKSGIRALDELGEQDIFKRLEKFGTWPLSLEPKGRSQPFLEKEIEEKN